MVGRHAGDARRDQGVADAGRQILIARGDVVPRDGEIGEEAVVYAAAARVAGEHPLVVGEQPREAVELLGVAEARGERLERVAPLLGVEALEAVAQGVPNRSSQRLSAISALMFFKVTPAAWTISRRCRKSWKLAWYTL
jgi:hypothetical protein